MSSRISYALTVVMLLLAAALRIWQLTTLPGGLNPQELAHVSLMRDSIQHGDIRVFYELQGHGQEGLYHGALAVSSLVFGTGVIGLRIPSVFASLVTLALLYSLGKRLFGVSGGLGAVALMTVTMWPILLSRLVMVEMLLPLFVTAVMLTLARAMPVYPHFRTENTRTLDFALLGGLLGLSLYVHPAGLLLILMAMTFIVYILFTVRPLSLRQLSYIGFAVLMTIITAMPYMISTIRLPEFNASTRIIGDYGSIMTSIMDSLGALLLRGDSNILYNVPQRPLFDLLTGMIVLLGAVMSIFRWREPRHALLLIAAALLAPPALLANNSPNFLAMSVVLPVLALFFGNGLACLLEQRRKGSYSAALILLFGLGVFNLGWTWGSLFQRWQTMESVETAYNHDIASIAHYLDLTSGDIPTVLCFPNWSVKHERFSELSSPEQILLLMNRDDAPLRYADCSSGLVFPDGGQHFQVAIPSSDIYAAIAPSVAKWLSLGTSVPTLPDNAVIEMNIQSELADKLGLYTTTTPATLVTSSDVSDKIPILPPIRFGGNITWLGYEMDTTGTYEAGSTVPVITYWRVEGIIPPDLTIFTHILSDPVTLAANRDTISANPAQLQDRDVFLQITDVPLPDNMLPDIYDVSTGIYQDSSDTRLPVFVNANETRGDRIFLYSITVTEAETSDPEK